MESEDELFARLEAEQPAITCRMRHPAGDQPYPNPGPLKAVDCTRPAAYIAMIHDCRKKRDYPNNGSFTLICVEYLDVVRKIEFPVRCAGCNHDFTTMLSIIWDIQHIHA